MACAVVHSAAVPWQQSQLAHAVLSCASSNSSDRVLAIRQLYLTVPCTAGVNFIGHFHLVQLLLPMLQRQQGAVRIVAVTCKGELDPGATLIMLYQMSQVLRYTARFRKGSPLICQHAARTCTCQMCYPCCLSACCTYFAANAHVLHPPPAALRMTDLNFSKVNYDPLKAYKGSKMALALFAKELAARTVGSNITVYAADPGNTGGCKAGLWYVGSSRCCAASCAYL